MSARLPNWCLSNSFADRGDPVGATFPRAMLEIGAMRVRLALAPIILFSFTIASADEAIFALTYTTDLLPKGRWEFEQWVTSRWEKEHGTYSVLDFREELEYGLTDDFQIGLYLNHHYVDANDEVER